MRYNNNFQISLWDEFKLPIILFSFVLFIMIGLNNTFYTSFTIDSNKVDVAWSEIKGEKKVYSHINAVQQSPISQERSQTSLPSTGSMSENTVVVAASEPVQEAKNEYVVIDGDISVSATEFYHPKLGNILTGSMVSGYLEVQNGEVKGLSVQLNSDQSKDIGMQMISTGESQIQGNIFVYEIEGKNYTATVYPTSPGEYMVSFVNGPWNGARVKFATQQENTGASENDMNVPQPAVDAEEAMPEELSRDVAAQY